MDTEKVECSKAKAAGSETRVEESSKADGSTKVYMRFQDMLKMFDREDLEVLYRIVKDRFKSTKPVGDNRVLWGNLMTMFEPSRGDEMWREQGRYLIKSLKLIDSCGVHCLMLESMYIYMLVEKEYPLAQFTYRRIWEGKLQVDYECEMAFELLSEYHKSMETIGIPPDKYETDENEEGKPLSAGKSSEVSEELFQKAHLYVIQNTDEIVPYIERQKQVLKTENPGKRIAFLENENSKSFAKCLRKEVERERVSNLQKKVYQKLTFLSFCFAANTLVKDLILSINFLLPVWFICLYTRLSNPGDAPDES
ncbi:hypothetical protein Tco_1021184 [Tanacetum coccineum]